jgi:phosphoribosyl-AMP cyclohydrolase / phosphoribosyl-ATP pyrophosphohydrolase
MVGYVNRTALAKTLETGFVTFWSRSRSRLWTKGEESGNTLALASLHVDCDSDTLLALVHPNGPTCHRDTPTCFDAQTQAGFAELVVPGARLAQLFSVLERRKLEGAAAQEQSYSRMLFAAGLDRCLRKVGEEASEFIIAAKTLEADAQSAAKQKELASEAADVLFHLFASLTLSNVTLEDVCEELRSREGNRRPGATLEPKI